MPSVVEKLMEFMPLWFNSIKNNTEWSVSHNGVIFSSCKCRSRDGPTTG